MAMFSAYIVKVAAGEWLSPWWLVRGHSLVTCTPHLQVGVNTNLMYKSDKLSEGERDPGQQLAWLRETLGQVSYRSRCR